MKSRALASEGLYGSIGRRALAPWLVIGAVSWACATAVRVPFDVSAPEVIPAGIKGKIDPDGLTTLYLEDLDVEIEVGNYRQRDTHVEWGLLPLFPFFLPIPMPATVASDTSSSEVGGPHQIFLTFNPSEQGFIFNPETVTVTLDQGSAVSMVAFMGPVNESCVGEWGVLEAGRDFNLTPQEATCFGLRFPLQTSPNIAFRLSLSGLSREGQPVTPIELRFVRFSGSVDE